MNRWVQLAYLVSTALFIFSLKWMNKPDSARRGVVAGVCAMLLAVGGMTQIIIELELNQFFGKRRIKNMIDKLQNHYIVCGYGRVGRGAAGEQRPRRGVRPRRWPSVREAAAVVRRRPRPRER